MTKILLPMVGAALVGALMVVNAHAPVAPAPAESIVSVPPAPVAEQVSAAPAPPASVVPITHQAWVDAIKQLPPPCIAPEALPAPLRPAQTKTNRLKE